jgi:hypothetical protein
MYYLPSSAVGQQLVTATVHLAGAVETETGHVANAGGAHITARLGGLLLYFLDRDAVAGFVRSVAAVRKLAAGAFDERTAPALPGDRDVVEQSIGLVIRLRGVQDVGRPTAATAAASRDGGPFVALRLGGLRVVVRDRIALQAVTLVAETADRASALLWVDSEDADDDVASNRQTTATLS